MRYNLFAKLYKLFLSKEIYKSIKANTDLYSKDYEKKVNQEYKNMVRRLNSIGGLKNTMEFIFYFFCYFVSFYTASEGKMTEEEFSKILKDFENSKIFKKSVSNKNAFSKREKNVYKKIEKMSQTKKYSDNWVCTFEDGDDEYFFTMSECGLCKIAKRENVEHLVKYFCHMDIPSYKAMNVVLDRTKTLAYEDDCCNFHIMTKEKAKKINFKDNDDQK